MAVPYRITIRLSEDDMDRMERLLDRYNYESISEIIRIALREFLEKMTMKELIKKLKFS